MNALTLGGGLVLLGVGFLLGWVVCARANVRDRLDGFRTLSAISERRYIKATDIHLAFDPTRRLERIMYRRSIEDRTAREQEPDPESSDDTPPG